MKKFTKDMLVPGKHVVELRNGERYLVVEFDGTTNLTNFKCYFMDLYRYTGDLYLKDGGFTYRVGETVVPDSFDEDRWNECSNGIHFFITKQEAIDY